MYRIYHICPLLLIFILLLTSCSMKSVVDRNDPSLVKDTFKQEKQQGEILYNQALQQLGETYPEALELYQQARTAEAMGELDNAILIYHKAMQNAPEDGLLLTALGMAYLREEDIIPARRYLRKAVNLDPDYYKSRLGLGYIYLQNKQIKQAVTQLETSLLLLPTLEGTFLLGEAVKLQGNSLRARQLYQIVIQADKDGKLGKAAKSSLRSLSK